MFLRTLCHSTNSSHLQTYRLPLGSRCCTVDISVRGFSSNFCRKRRRFRAGWRPTGRPLHWRLNGGWPVSFVAGGVEENTLVHVALYIRFIIAFGADRAWDFRNFSCRTPLGWKWWGGIHLNTKYSNHHTRYDTRLSFEISDSRSSAFDREALFRSYFWFRHPSDTSACLRCPNVNSRLGCNHSYREDPVMVFNLKIGMMKINSIPWRPLPPAFFTWITWLI